MVGASLLHPQEIEVFYIIPTLKRYLAVAMKEQGLKQVKIAELLGVDKAAISQYITKKRGNKVDFDEDVVEEIKKSAQRITDHLSMMKEMQHLIRFIRSSGALCTVHKHLSGIPGTCNPKEINCFGGGR